MKAKRWFSSGSPTLRILAFFLMVLMLPLVASAEDTSTMEELFSILEARKQHPTTFDDFDKLATMAYARGQYEEALGYLDRCVELAGPEETGILGALLTQKGVIYKKQGMHLDALDALNAAEAYTPDNPQMLMTRAELRMELGEYGPASVDLEHYLRLLPEDAPSWQLIAKAYKSMGDKNKASEAEDKAEALAQSEGNAVLTSARRSALYGDLESAKAGYDAYLKGSDDEGGRVHFLLAATRMELGELESAINDLEAALALGYEEPAVCYEYLSSCHFVLGNYERVLETGDRALAYGSEKPAYDTLFQRMGIAALSLGRAEDAVTYFTQSMEANDALLGNRYYRGLSNMGAGLFEAAIEDYTAAIELDELAQRCLYNRGLCNVQLGDIPAAVKDLEAAMNLPDEEEVAQEAEDILWQLALQYMSEANTAESSEQ